MEIRALFIKPRFSADVKYDQWVPHKQNNERTLCSMSLLMALPDGINPTLLEIMDPNDGVNYYTDLELAAAIGKNLLGRNKELDHLLHATQEYAEEQVIKSEYLSHQLDEARQMNESRAKLMEQIECNSEELSRSHTKLKMETRSIWEHNQSLTESIETLVEKCDHYKTEMEGLRMANARLQHHLSTQNSVEAASEDCQPRDHEKELIEKEVLKLSVAIQELKTEQNQEKSAREELENGLSQLIIQNQDLENKLQLFAKGSSSRNSYVEENEKDSTNKDTQVEEEIDAEEDGSYLDGSFVLVESQDIEELDSDMSQEQCDISFLDELDQQYRELVTKYNSLLEKCKNEGIPYESREMCVVQRGVQTSEMGEAEDGGSVEKGMPEYKKMFAMIYEKLREGRNDCDGSV